MKQIKVLFFTLALAALFAACGGNANHQHQHDQSQTPPAATEGKANQPAEEQGPEYTSAYICPMHCKGSGSDKPGQCPVCGMDYEKREEHGH
ncbi:MAG: hypothetical protein JNK89_04145 [Saprospiraceae bacterium]|nr:hypothetical protein [Saprospiraceae bacterium]